MTVTINGTTGIAGVDGSAATPAGQGVDTDTGVFYGTDIVGISTGGTERMRINASGQAEFAAGTAALPAISTTGDTNTGIFFSAADTIDFAEGGVATGQFDSSGNFKFNSGYGSAAVAYGCRAWVNFDGTTNTAGFCTIRGSGNVTSVADDGTGVYTVNFTTAMPDINYAVAATSMEVGTTGTTDRTASIRRNTLVSDSMATTFVKVAGWNAAGAAVDSGVMVVSVFR
jgi:hypothetical protein